MIHVDESIKLYRTVKWFSNVLVVNIYFVVLLNKRFFLVVEFLLEESIFLLEIFSVNITEEERMYEKI